MFHASFLRFMPLDPEKYRYFKQLFYPKSIAIVGASEQSVLFIVPLLEANFPGKVYPIKPNRKKLCVLKCFSYTLD